MLSRLVKKIGTTHPEDYDLETTTDYSGSTPGSVHARLCAVSLLRCIDALLDWSFQTLHRDIKNKGNEEEDDDEDEDEDMEQDKLVSVESIRKLLVFRGTLLEDAGSAFAPLKKTSTSPTGKKGNNNKKAKGTKRKVNGNKKKFAAPKKKNGSPDKKSSGGSSKQVFPPHTLSPMGCLSALSLLTSRNETDEDAVLIDKEGEQELFVHLRLHIVDALVGHLSHAKRSISKSILNYGVRIVSQAWKGPGGTTFQEMLLICQQAGVALIREMNTLLLLSTTIKNRRDEYSDDDKLKTKQKKKIFLKMLNRCDKCASKCLIGYSECITLAHYDPNNKSIRPLIQGSFPNIKNPTVSGSLYYGTQKLQQLLWKNITNADLRSTSMITSALRALNTLNYCVVKTENKTMSNNASFYKRLCTVAYNDGDQQTTGEKKIVSDRSLLTSFVRSFIRFNVRLRQTEALKQRSVKQPGGAGVDGVEEDDDDDVEMTVGHAHASTMSTPLTDILTPIREVATAITLHKKAHSNYSQTQHSQVAPSMSGFSAITRNNCDTIAKDVVGHLNKSLNDCVSVMDRLRHDMARLTTMICQQEQEEDDDDDSAFVAVQNDDGNSQEQQQQAHSYRGKCSSNLQRLHMERNEYEETTADVYDHLTSCAKIGKEMLALMGGASTSLSDLVMKFFIKFYRSLCVFTKGQIKFLTKCRIKVLPRTITSMVRFVQIVTSSHHSMTQDLYQKLSELGRDSEEEDDEADDQDDEQKRQKKLTLKANTRARVATRRSKTVPELVFQIEAWETELLKLTSLKHSNKLKIVDLGSAAKFNRISRNRDFKIVENDMKELSEEEEEDDDDDGEEEEDEEEVGGTVEEEEEEEDVGGTEEDDDDEEDENDDEETQAFQNPSKRRKTQGEEDL
jgi:hypothetical protein